MQPSMEVRWLMRGDRPANVAQWFSKGFVPKQNAILEEELDRLDTYLSLPSNKDLSVKLRAGKKIEVKQRQGQGQSKVLKDGIRGLVEQWVKWSFALDAQAASPDFANPAGCWVTVKKSRLTRKFEIKPGDLVVAIDAIVANAPAAKPPDEGCNMELAWLTSWNGQAWWSLGFEAFGKLGTVEKNLDLVLKQVLADPAFPIMKAEDSYAYPTWLGILLAGK